MQDILGRPKQWEMASRLGCGPDTAGARRGWKSRSREPWERAQRRQRGARRCGRQNPSTNDPPHPAQAAGRCSTVSSDSGTWRSVLPSRPGWPPGWRPVACCRDRGADSAEPTTAGEESGGPMLERHPSAQSMQVSHVQARPLRASSTVAFCDWLG